MTGDRCRFVEDELTTEARRHGEGRGDLQVAKAPRRQGVQRRSYCLAPSRLLPRQSLILAFASLREGEAPAEPQPPDSVSPGSRLSRSFALPDEPGSTPILSLDGTPGGLTLNSFSLSVPPCLRGEFPTLADSPSLVRGRRSRQP